MPVIKSSLPRIYATLEPGINERPDHEVWPIIASVDDGKSWFVHIPDAGSRKAAGYLVELLSKGEVSRNKPAEKDLPKGGFVFHDLRIKSGSTGEKNIEDWPATKRNALVQQLSDGEWAKFLGVYIDFTLKNSGDVRYIEWRARTEEDK